MGPIRVVIVGGSDLLVAGLQALLRRERSLHVLGAVTDVQRGLDLVLRLRPDVVLVEYRLADRDARELCARIVSAEVGVAPVVLFGQEDEDAVAGAFDAGARGFVHVRTSASDLLQGVRDAAEGRSVLDPRLTSAVVDRLHRSAARRPASLSNREMEVMGLITEGASDTEIAERLNVSRNTIRTYVRRSLDKLACDSRSEAAAKLARWSG